jgi:hypothetical protein
MAEYGVELKDNESKFNPNWSPEAPAGLKFTSVVPDDFGAGYQALPSESDQTELRTKMKSSRLRSRRHSKVFFLWVYHILLILGPDLVKMLKAKTEKILGRCLGVVCPYWLFLYFTCTPMQCNA